MANRVNQRSAGRTHFARLNAFTAREMFQRLRVQNPDEPDSELVLQVHLWITQRDRRGFINLYGGRTVPPARHTVYQWISGRIGNTYANDRIPSLLGVRPPVTSPREPRAGVAAQLDRIEAQQAEILQKVSEIWGLLYIRGRDEARRNGFTEADFDMKREDDFHANV